MSLRIALLTTYFSPPHVHGGVDTVALELKKGLERCGCTVHVYVPAFRKTAAIDAASTATDTFRLPCPKLPFLYNFFFARRVRPLIAAGSYDAVINLQSLLGWKLGFHPHLAVVPTTALGEAGSMKITGPGKLLNYLARQALGYRYEKRLFRQCDRVIAVGEHIADEIRTCYGLPAERVVSIGNGVDHEKFSPAPQPGPRQGPPTVLYVGRLVSRKNVGLLLEAGGALARRGVEFRIELAGAGEDRPRLERLAQTLGLGDRAKFLGRVSLDQLPDLYRRSDIIVVPSRYEGIPMVLLEAQACGLPAVVADFPGADRIVEDGQSGLVLRQAAPSTLADALAHLLGQPELALRMGRRGREVMIERFSWDTVVDQYLQLLRELGPNVRQRGAERAPWA